MKRSPLKRRAPLKRGGRLERHGQIPRVNRERLARRRAEQFGEQAELCRGLPCCACGAPPPSDPAHVVSRGAGGRDADCVPLCRACHGLQHSGGIKSFELEAGVDLAAVAAELRARLA